MRRHVIFFTARRFTGVAADAVIGSEVKRMLFGAIWIETNFIHAVDVQTYAEIRSQNNRVAVAIAVLRNGVMQFCVFRLVVAHRK